MSLTTVAANVRAELARRQLRQGEVAEHLGMTQRAVSRRVRGEVEWNGEQLRLLAQLFEIPVSTLLGEELSA